MTFNIVILKNIMDKVRNDPALAPVKNADGTTTTFCNFNAYNIAKALGLNMFWNSEANRPMMANEAVDYMLTNPARFLCFHNHLSAFTLVNQGHLVFAALKNTPHGHIVPVYPSVGMETSGKWMAQVPYCSNVGARNDIMGLNYAFADVPCYYLTI